jgi:L-fucono-1,5-lactonase
MCRRDVASSKPPINPMTSPRIDTHQHFWKFSPAAYDWITPDMGALQRDFGPEDLEPELRSARIDGTLAVEARGHLEETDNLLRIAEQTPFVRGVVGWLPLTLARAGSLIDRYAQRPKLKGLRHWMGAPNDTEYMAQEALHYGVSLLEQARLTYDLMLWPLQLPAVARFVDRHPHQLFVVDHFAKPFIKDGTIEPWRRDIAELGRRPNVYCKLSGLAREADNARWSTADLRPYFDVALGAFGPGRLMFGSDWPVCTLATSYTRWVDSVGELLAELGPSERDRIMGGTAVEAYRLEPDGS